MHLSPERIQRLSSLANWSWHWSAHRWSAENGSADEPTTVFPAGTRKCICVIISVHSSAELLFSKYASQGNAGGGAFRPQNAGNVAPPVSNAQGQRKSKTQMGGVEGTAGVLIGSQALKQRVMETERSVQVSLTFSVFLHLIRTMAIGKLIILIHNGQNSKRPKVWSGKLKYTGNGLWRMVCVFDRPMRSNTPPT